MHDKDATPIEAIDFETQHESAQANKESKQALNHKPVLWFSFITLLLCTALVFLFLPKYVENSRQKTSVEKKDAPPLEGLVNERSNEKLVEPVVEQEPNFSAEELNALKQNSEELLLQLINIQKLLESKAVEKWAGEEFKIALTLGSSGDEYFRKQKYTAAISSYKDVIITICCRIKISCLIYTYSSSGCI